MISTLPSPIERIDAGIVCCYLYPISRYGYPPPAADTVKHLEEMRSLGFRSVELEGIREDHLEGILRRESEITAWIESNDIEIPYFCVVLPGLSSPDAHERERNLRLFEKGCALGARLGAKGVLDNGPVPPYVFDANVPVARHFDEDVLGSGRIPDTLDWSLYWRDLAGTFRDVCDVAGEHGLTYQIHPCMGVLTATSDGFLRLFDAVGRDNLRFNFDTANLFLHKENLTVSLLKLAGLVDYIHISDNRGTRGEHLVPGDGAIHWDAFFETLDRIGFEGHFGLDIGGPETGLEDLDGSYLRAATWLSERWPKFKDEL